VGKKKKKNYFLSYYFGVKEREKERENGGQKK
jgi:hypothetical protein